MVSLLLAGGFFLVVFAAGVLGCNGTQHQSPVKPEITSAIPGFEIRLHRPQTVGQRFHLSASGKKQRDLKMFENKEVFREKREEIAVMFEGEGLIVSADGQGRATESEFIIERFEIVRDNAPKYFFSKGDILRIIPARGTQNPKNFVITVNEMEISNKLAISAPVREEIAIIFQTYVSTVTDDDVFGTTQRQVPGAQWPIDSDIAERSFADNLGIDSKLSGTTKLIQRTTFQDTDCLELYLKIDGTVSRVPGQPPGAILSNGTISAIHRGVMPTDLAKPELSFSEEMKMHAFMSLQSEQIEATEVIQKQVTYKPL